MEGDTLKRVYLLGLIRELANDFDLEDISNTGKNLKILIFLFINEKKIVAFLDNFYEEASQLLLSEESELRDELRAKFTEENDPVR